MTKPNFQRIESAEVSQAMDHLTDVLTHAVGDLGAFTHSDDQRTLAAIGVILHDISFSLAETATRLTNLQSLHSQMLTQIREIG